MHKKAGQDDPPGQSGKQPETKGVSGSEKDGDYWPTGNSDARSANGGILIAEPAF
jgi:hypothetical protein